MVWIEKLNVNCAPSGPEGKWLNLTNLIKNMTESHFTLKKKLCFAKRKCNKKMKPILLPLSLSWQLSIKNNYIHQTLYTSGHIMVMRIWGIIVLNCHKKQPHYEKKISRLYFINAKSNFFPFLILGWNETWTCFWSDSAECNVYLGYESSLSPIFFLSLNTIQGSFQAMGSQCKQGVNSF